MPDPAKLDEILARVREEANRPEYQVPDLAAPAATAPGDGNRSSGPARSRPTAEEPPRTVEAFLLLADVELFIDQAYRRFLGRAPDPAGAADYRSRLAEGYGRTFVLAALAAAREPGAPQTRLPGLGLAIPVYNLWRVLRRLGLESLARRINGSYGRWRLRRALSSEAALARRAGELQSLQEQLTALAEHSDGGLNSLESAVAELRSALATQSEAQHALATTQAQQANALQDAESALRRELAIIGASARARRLVAPAVDGQTPASTGAPELAPETVSETVLETAPLAQRLDAYYFAFEATHRGSEAVIRDGQRPYLEALAGLPAPLAGLPVLDIGCGRGEWLTLLREHGFTGRGVDLSEAMVACSREHGLPVAQEDGLAALRDCEDDSLAAVSAFHLIEHLPFATLFQLLEEAARVIAPGGLLLLETPNPENVLVGSHTFYHDFSHRNPVTPSALDFLVGYHGFEERRLLRLNPYPPEARVAEESLTAQRVNGHFCGPQDLGLVARKPPRPE